MTNAKEYVERREGTRSPANLIRYALLGLTVATLQLPAPQLQAQQPAPQLPMPQPNMNYAPGQKSKIEGAIISRNGDDMLIRQQNSQELSIVTITEGTELESPSGVLNVSKKKQDAAMLVPGLFVKVRGEGGDRGNLVARRISFHKTALKVANQISAGEVELRAVQQVTIDAVKANRDSIKEVTERSRDSLAAIEGRARDSLAAINSRLANLDNYDVKYTGVVHFATGSSKLSPTAKRTLDSMVTAGMGLKGYAVEVAGFADITGTESMNQGLSERRADAVVSYLAGQRNVPLRRIVNPSGLGTAQPVASNSTSSGRARNRRVEIKVLQNRAQDGADQP